MNIYHELNQMIEYIEDHLDGDISCQKLSQILAVNEYTMQRLFSLLCNVSLAEYIRKRRLSQAGYDLYYQKGKVMDIALKYGYGNATSFSRAFEKFHGVKPSQVKNSKTTLKNFPKFVFTENNFCQNDMEYEIIELDSFSLYGKGISTDYQKIGRDAPDFCSTMNQKYLKKYGPFDYGMVVYEDRFQSDKCEYWVLWNQEIEEFRKWEIPKSKWLVFRVPNMEAVNIQKASNEFYCQFLPSCKYNLRDIPELEYYHDGVTDFLVPIE